ncbi:ABC transporter permease [Candidatus Sumerlaeota bacterium]|nr:ABC transporter permease [Candidatus Sumerlaeota bacterium]
MSYFLQKFGLSLATLIVVGTLCFLLTKAAGEEAAFGEKNPSPEVRAAISKQWLLDQPLHVQYIAHMKKLLQLDSMPSRKQKGRTLRDVLKEHLPQSLSLGFRALIVAVTLGVPIGAFCAVNHNRIGDNAGTFLALMGVSVPSFVLATFALIVLSREWHVGGLKLGPMPAIQWYEPAMGAVQLAEKSPAWLKGIIIELGRLRLWIPAMCLGAFPFAAVLRLTRSSMLEALRQDYIRTARAKGVAAWKVVGRHALRNALTPVVTFLGPVSAGVLTGSLVIEKIFAIPGIGQFFVESVNNRDLPLIMGLTFFYSALLVFMNLVVDAIYPILNPRLRG